MAKRSKIPAGPNRLNAVLMLIGVVITLIIVISTASAIITHISNTRADGPDDPAGSEASAAYRGLDEFTDDDARLAYAASLLDQRLYRTAAAFLSEFLEGVEADSRLSAAIRYDRGLAYLYLQEYEQAVSDFTAVTAQADYPDAYYNLGNALAGLQNYEEALEAYDTALKLEQKPEYMEARDAVLALLE